MIWGHQRGERAIPFIITTLLFDKQNQVDEIEDSFFLRPTSHNSPISNNKWQDEVSTSSTQGS